MANNQRGGLLPAENKIEEEKIESYGDSASPANPGSSRKKGFFLLSRTLWKAGVIWSMLLFAGVLVVFNGCSPQREMDALSVDTTQTFSSSGTARVPDRWWAAFDDPRLNLLVDSALTSNFNLKSAWQRLREARAVSDRAASSLFPSLDASAQGELSQYQRQFDQNQQLRLGLSAQYEVDLWGRIRSSVEAERYRARASLSDYQTAGLSVSAEVARTWYQLMVAHKQRALIEQQIVTNEKVMSLIRARFGSGQVRSVDILRQRQLLESTREQKIQAERTIRLLEHQLAVLLGRVPQGALEYQKDSLPGMPALPETGVPAGLIRRRPDVRSAFQRLQAADSDLASAISNQYPRFSISASVSTAADQAGNLFEDWARSLAGNLLTPILYGGQLRAEVDRAEAVRQQRLYEYGQAMLTAFREVEDALVRENKQRERIASLEEQLQLARDAYQQLRVGYFNGVTDYLDVLTALDEVQQLQRDLLTSRLLLVEYRIALYRSLAGSIEPPTRTIQQ